MFTERSRMSPLDSRKEFLLAESELNRAQLLDDWHVMSGGVHRLTARAKSVSSLASVGAMLLAAVTAFRHGRASQNGAKSSWLQTALKGAKVAGSLWLAIRARPK